MEQEAAPRRKRHRRVPDGPVSATCLRQEPSHAEGSNLNGHEVKADAVVEVVEGPVDGYFKVRLAADRTIMGWIKAVYLHDCQVEAPVGTGTGVAHSFRATTNERAFVASPLKGKPQPVLQIIKSSRTFKTAFQLEDAADRRRRHPTADSPRGDAPQPVVIRSSAADGDSAMASSWGLVSTIVEAYNGHHDLVLRPDDVWQAILTQFSFYVTAHAEELRDRFVDFQGKKTLVVVMGGTLFTADYATFTRRMVHENILKNIKDPSVVEWLLPGFSTTTATDEVAASVSIMSTLQAYFSYVCCLRCGIPKVTLLGTPADWRRLREKADRLPEYDLDGRLMSKWHGMLAPVLDQLARSADGGPSLDFWDRVCDVNGGGSGPTYLSGWVTVFAAFTHRGEWQGEVEGKSARGKRIDSSWPVVDFENVPAGALSVPVLVDDNGTQYDTHMFAGLFASEGCGGEGVALRPRTDWCIAYLGEPRAQPMAYTHGEVVPSPPTAASGEGETKAAHAAA